MSEETVKKQQSRTLQRSRVGWRRLSRGRGAANKIIFAERQRRVARSCSFGGDMEETVASVPVVEMPGDKLQW